MEVRVRSRKDASITKTLPLKVYENLKHAWVRIEDGNEIDEDFKKKDGQNVNAPPAEVKFHSAVVVTDGTIVELEAIPEKDASLQTEYEVLSGKKPDGRWSEEKLKARITELKTRLV